MGTAECANWRCIMALFATGRKKNASSFYWGYQENRNSIQQIESHKRICYEPCFKSNLSTTCESMHWVPNFLFFLLMCNLIHKLYERTFRRYKLLVLLVYKYTILCLLTLNIHFFITTPQ